MNKNITPLPWKAEPSDHDPKRYDIRGPESWIGMTVSNDSEANQANAQFIVHAANNHGPLVEALETLLRTPDLVMQGLDDATINAIDKARTALAAARADERQPRAKTHFIIAADGYGVRKIGEEYRVTAWNEYSDLPYYEFPTRDEALDVFLELHLQHAKTPFKITEVVDEQVGDVYGPFEVTE